MKLYCTVASERASKGQGGNEYLDIDILVGDAKNPFKLARLTVRRSDELDGENGTETGGYAIYDERDEIVAYITDNELRKEQSKGNKQEGEHVHDWDTYGKCNSCKAWDTEGERY